MVGKKSDLGPSGVALTQTIRSLREARRLSYAELSRRLGEMGREIPPLGLRRIESGDRRVDVDDLVALAVALDVSPVTLLMPETTGPGETVMATGVIGELTALQLWDWLRGSYPLPSDERLTLVFRSAAWPGWRLTDQVDQDRKTQSAWLKARRAQKKLEADGDD